MSTCQHAWEPVGDNVEDECELCGIRRDTPYPPCKQCGGPNDMAELCAKCGEANEAPDLERAGGWNAQR